MRAWLLEKEEAVNSEGNLIAITRLPAGARVLPFNSNQTLFGKRLEHWGFDYFPV